jgi:hypothetical protein
VCLRFDVTVIARYFPEFDGSCRAICRKPDEPWISPEPLLRVACSTELSAGSEPRHGGVGQSGRPCADVAAGWGAAAAR